MTPKAKKILSPAPLSTLFLLAGAFAFGTSACKTIPDRDEVEHYREQAEVEAQKEIAEVEARYQAGEIDQKAYESQVEYIKATTPERAYRALYTDYMLRESASGRR
ncbi:MAG: hypothetical protein AAGD22_15070 [Verrucomicrobiota bacterium]